MDGVKTYVETWLAAEMLSQISPSLTVYFLAQSAAKAAVQGLRREAPTQRQYWSERPKSGVTGTYIEQRKRR